MADVYAARFPDAYGSRLEESAAAVFAAAVRASPTPGVVIDVGSGLGHVTADLVSRGLDVIGVDPSTRMLEHARSAHPAQRFLLDDARLTSLNGPVVGIIARFSLIHVPPDSVPDVVKRWAELTSPGTPVLVAMQSTDACGEVEEFDHAVARAWRWHPDSVAEVLYDNGFDERWRIVSRPDPTRRFPEFHLLAERF